MKRLNSMVYLVLTLLTVGCRLAAAEPNDPKAVVASFYDWYLKQERKMPDGLTEQKSQFSGDLYNDLVGAYQAGHIDCDPFINAQSSAQHYRIGQVKVDGHAARVNVGFQLERNGATVVTVLLEENARQEWKISDFEYEYEDHKISKTWRLLHMLKANG